MNVLENVRISPDVKEILRRLHMAGDAPCALVADCIDQVWSLIDPKIAFRRCSITMIQDGCVYIDETCLKSRI